jgi:hypothetical protein
VRDISDNVSMIDDARTVCLCGDGLPGYVAAVLVARDGREDLVLVRTELLGDGVSTYRHDARGALHEQTGELPSVYRRRVNRAQLRCGRPTKADRPCRTPVAHAGDTCCWHRIEATHEHQETR